MAKEQRKREKPVTLKKEQQYAFDRMVEFIRDNNAKVFILKGYAGTGKTTMMKVLVEELSRRNLPYSLLASTGRAAKILSNVTNRPAQTIHGEIYKYQGLSEDLDRVVRERERTGVDSTGQILIKFDFEQITREDTNVWYYIVDEASMVSDTEDKTATQAVFGNGRLLQDLLNYDAVGKFIFVGDACQLPPIQQKLSPALSASYFRDVFNIQAEEVELTEIIRQEAGNDLLFASQRLRKLYFNPPSIKWAKFPFRGYKNIHLANSQVDLLQGYVDDVKKNGFNYATLLCQSNRQCDTLTRFLRPAFGITSPQLSPGDLLLVTQNNNISNLMNGDLVVVKSIEIKEKRAGLTFLKVSVEELFTKKVNSQLLIADILYGNQTNLSQPQQKELFIDFFIRMKQKKIGQKHPLFKKMLLDDPYLNALRAVFGYALTCHKAQGGEWNHVYLDIPRSFPLTEKPYVYQWVYTAITRAKEELYTINDFWVE